MNNPLITVILPIYNMEDYIDKCLNSLLKQTYKNLEIILVNDGSTDRSAVICEKYKNIDKRFKVLHKENGGTSSARNMGLDHATGEYIGFVDADDFIEKDMYESLYSALYKQKTEIAVCGHSIDIDGKTVKTYSFEEIGGKIDRDKAIEYMISGTYFEGYSCNKLLSVDILKKAGNGNLLKFNENYHVCEDLVFMCQCFLLCSSISYVKAPLYHYVMRDGSALRSFNQKRLSELAARQEVIDMFSNHNLKLNEISKNLYVESSITILRDALSSNRTDLAPELIKEAKKYKKCYYKSDFVNLKKKIRAFIFINFPTFTQ